MLGDLTAGELTSGTFCFKGIVTKPRPRASRSPSRFMEETVLSGSGGVMKPNEGPAETYDPKTVRETSAFMSTILVVNICVSSCLR